MSHQTTGNEVLSDAPRAAGALEEVQSSLAQPKPRGARRQRILSSAWKWASLLVPLPALSKQALLCAKLRTRP
jgi:hypothetical protein